MKEAPFLGVGSWFPVYKFYLPNATPILKKPPELLSKQEDSGSLNAELAESSPFDLPVPVSCLFHSFVCSHFSREARLRRTIFVSIVQSQPLDLLVFQVWSMFSHGRKKVHLVFLGPFASEAYQG